MGNGTGFPLVNGFAPSFASFSFTPQWTGGSFETDAWREVKWGDKIEEALLRGKAGRVILRTEGIYSTDGCSMSMWTEEAERFMADLKAIAGTNRGIASVIFDLVCTWTAERNGASKTSSRLLKSCRILGRPETLAASDSADGSYIEFPLGVLELQYNGITLGTPSGA